MPLASGQKLGPYELSGPLGAGGMGEVYRARDTRLGRDVAIKVLPKEMSADPVRKQRFEREAKTISGLNHPNICVLYDVGSQDGVDYLVMECVEGETLARRLAKAPDERWQSASDLASELKWIADFGPQASAASTARSGHRLTLERIVWGLALTAALVALAVGIARWRQEQGAEVTRYTIDPPEQGKFLFGGIDEGPAVSPDGRQIAFIATVGGVKQVWVKPAESLRAQALPGTDNAVSAFWSPDSKNLAFETEGKLKRVSLSGGSPQTICDLPTTIRGGSWSRRDVILFGATPGPIYRVSASGGTPQVVTSLKRGDILHRWPFFLPDENHFLYLASQATTMQESSALFVGSLDGQADRMLFRASSAVAYANGYLLYLSGQLLMARAFDPARLEFTGNALPVADGILLDPYFGATTFSVSQNGVLVFQLGKPYSGYALQVFDRSGKEIASLREAGVYFRPRFSPDGKQIAYGSLTLASAKADIFVWDITAGSNRRITFNSTYKRRLHRGSKSGNDRRRRKIRKRKSGITPGKSGNRTSSY